MLASAQLGQIVHYTYDNDGNPQYTGVIMRPEGGDYLFIHPFAVDPADETKIFFPSGDHFFRHTGNGNWQELSNVSSTPGTVITAVAVSQTGHRLYYAAFSQQGSPSVYRLNNANTATDGETNVSIPGVPAGSYPHGIAIHPTNPDEALVVFSNYSIVGLYHTSNGGSTWTAVEGNLTGQQPDSPGPSLRNALIYVDNGQPRYLVATSTGVYSTGTLSGNGTVWSLESPDGMGNVVVNALHLRVSDNHIAAGTHGRGVFTATAGGGQPEIADGDINGDAEANVIDVVLGVNFIVDPGGHPLTTEQRGRGDVFPPGGGDDVLNTQDITRIVNFILKKDTPSAPVGGVGPVLVSVGTPVTAGATSVIPVTIRGEAVAGGQFAITLPGAEWLDHEVLAEGLGLAAHADGDQLRVLFYDLDNAVPKAGITVMLPYRAATTAAGPQVSGLLVSDPHGFARETSVERDAGSPGSVPYLQASPNPATAGTVISFQLGADAMVRLAVFDVQGRTVRELVSGPRPAGAHEIPWDGHDDLGSRLPSGIYFYRLTTPETTVTRKLVIQG
jgi:hypothetical protein